MTNTSATDGIRFEARQDVQPLYGRGADEHWRYTDRAGHAHSYAGGYPTLVKQTRHVPCDDPDCFSGGYCDGYEESWYECPLCGEVVRPGTTQKTYYQAGQMTYAIDGRPVGVEEFNRRLAEEMARIRGANHGTEESA
jgi:hypothetical protein